MKKGILITNAFLRQNKYLEIYELLSEAFRGRAELAQMTNAECGCFFDKHTPDYDFVLFWDKDVFLARHLENIGYRVINSSEAIRLCDDKMSTYLALEGKVPMPHTVPVPFTFANIGYNDYEFLNDYGLGFPLVLKENKGSFGQQVYYIDSLAMLKSKVSELAPRPMLLQQLVTSSFGRDMRVQVVGGKVVAAVERRAADGMFISNVTGGGKMFRIEPPKEYVDVALCACKTLGVEFAGVDLLFGEHSPLLIEVNSSAHFKNLLEATGRNVANDLADYILGL